METFNITVEPEGDHVVIILHRIMDDFTIPIQFGLTLSVMLTRAATKLPYPEEPPDYDRVFEEVDGQIKYDTFDWDGRKFITFFVNHVDRIKLSQEGALQLAKFIELKTKVRQEAKT